MKDVKVQYAILDGNEYLLPLFYSVSEKYLPYFFMAAYIYLHLHKRQELCKMYVILQRNRSQV